MDKVDMNVQLKEYEEYGIPAISVCNIGNQNKIIKSKLLDTLKMYHGKIIIHIDECDFGSAETGKLKKYLDEINARISSDSEIRYVVYSATPEEAIFSEIKKNGMNYYLAHYKPGPKYNGPKWFLDNGLVEDPEEFYHYIDRKLTLSSQAKNIITKWNDSGKKFVVVRFNYMLDILGERKMSAFSTAKTNNNLQNAINTYLGKNKVKVHFYDQGNKFRWEFINKNEEEHGTWYGLAPGCIHLIVINGICTRGTEVGFRPEIFAWHDYRKSDPVSTTYATYAQAAGRVFHYNYFINNNEDVFFKNKHINTKLYVEKSLIETMDKVYSSNNIEDIREVWVKYNERPVSNRINISPNKLPQVLDVIGVLEPDAIKMIKLWQNQIKKDTRKSPSFGISSAKGQSKQDLCKIITVNGKIKGIHPEMLSIDFTEQSKVLLNNPDKYSSYEHFKKSDFKILKLSRQNLYDFYASQKVNILGEDEIINSLEKVAKSNSICYTNSYKYIVNKIQTVKGIDIINKVLHPLVDYSVKNDNEIKTVRSIHNFL